MKKLVSILSNTKLTVRLATTLALVFISLAFITATAFMQQKQVTSTVVSSGSTQETNRPTSKVAKGKKNIYTQEGGTPVAKPDQADRADLTVPMPGESSVLMNTFTVAPHIGITATKTWNGAGVTGGTGGTDFNAAANWLPATALTSTDDLVMNVSPATTVVVTTSASVTVNSLAVTMSGNLGATAVIFNLQIPNQTLTINGATTANNTTSGGGAHQLQFTVGNGAGTSAAMVMKGASDFGSSSTNTVFLRGVNSSTSNVFQFEGNVTMGAQAATSGTNFPSKVIFNGSGAQTVTINSTSIGWPSVDIGGANSPSVTFAGSSNAFINNANSPTTTNLTINGSSTLDLTTHTLNSNSTAFTCTFSLLSTSTIKLGAATGGITGSNFPSNFSTYTLSTTGTEVYNASAAQTINLIGGKGNLTCSNAAGITFGGAITTAGTLSVTTGTVNAGAFLLTTSGATTITTGALLSFPSGGTMKNAGTVTSTAATLTFASGAKYQHNFTTTAGTIPTATWSTGSTVEVIGYTSNSTATGGVGQSFSNFTWNCPSQTGNINFAGGLTTINGNFTVAATNTGSIRLAGNNSYTLTIGGDLIVTGGTLDLTNGNSSGNTQIVNIGGNFNQTGGTFTATSAGQRPLVVFTGGASSSVTFTQSAGTFTDTVINWQIASPKTLTFNNAFTLATGRTMTVNSGATLATAVGITNNGTLAVNGTFQINTGGFVSGTGLTYGNGSLLKYNTGGNYGRNGEWLPNVTSGAGYPFNVQLSNNTTLDLPNSATTQPFQMAGTLTIDSGSTMQMAGPTPLTQPLTVLGDVNINGTLTLSTATGGDIKVGGNWTRASAATFTPNGRAVTFNGTAIQAITVVGGGIETFNYLIVDKSTANSLALNASPATNVLVNATAGDVLQILNTGGINLNGQALTMTGAGGNLRVSGGARNILSTIAGGSFSFTGAKTITSTGGGTLVFGSNVNVFLQSAVDFGASLSTINGTLNMNSGGSVNTNPPTYSNASTLIYDCTCVYGRNAEWSQTSGPGYPNNVTVNASTDVNIGNTTPAVARQIAGTLDAKSGGNFLMDHPSLPMTATLTVLGNVLIETGGGLHLSTSSGGDLVTQGNFTNNGTFTPNNRAVFFTGGNTQTASDASSTLTMPYVRINKSGGTLQLNSNLTTLGPGGGDSIQFTGATSTLTLNGKTLTLGSTIGSIAAGSGFIGSTTSAMSLQDGGSAGAMGTLVFVSGGQSLQNLTMNRTGGSGSVALGTPLTINGALTLSNGIINTGVNTLTLTDTATATRTAGYVIGTYKKIYTTTGSFTYDVGTANGYSPLNANVTGLNGTSDLTVKPTQTAQPQIQTPSKALQRYWTLTEGGDLTATLTFNYLDPPDVPGTANETAFIVIKYDGANFTTPTGVVDFVNNKFTVPNVSSFSDWTLAEAIAPTAVKLINFNATSDNGLVRLEWSTGYEARNLGFNLYREQNGKRTRVTPSMLAGSALLTGPKSVLTAGHSYTWWDAPAQDRTGAAQYWLEDVDINGTRTLHGPIVPAIARTPLRKTSQRQAEVLGQRQQIGAGTGLQINGWPAASSNSGELTAVRADNSGIAGAKQDIQIGKPGIGVSDGPPSAGSGAPGALPTPQYIEPDTAVFQRQIADMAGVKFNVSKAGWYRIAQPELIAAGLDSNVNASHLQLFAGGVEVPMRVSGNGQQLTASDVIEFYGVAADLPTDGAQTYYLVQGQSYGKRIMKFVDKDAQPMPPPSGPDSYAYTLERKERLTYFPGLDNGEADNFFGQIITNNNSSPVLETLNVKHPYAQSASGAQAQLEISLQGVTAGSHLVHVLFNGTDAGVINFAGTDHIVQAIDVPASNVIDGDNVIQLSSLGGDADISLADTLRLTYAHAYVADNDALSLSVGSEDTVRVKGFTNGNVRVVDITDPNNSQELTPVVTAQPDGSFSADTQVIGANASVPRMLIVFADNGAAHPDSVRNSNPSHWAAEDAGADFLIISHRSLMASVQPLADLRRSQGMAVDVIDVEDLYDEFSFGAHSPQAIHEFIKRAANSWKVTPRYLLLVGDATYDPRNYLGQGANDMVPTKLLWATDMKTASDDWMADMDGDSIPELAVGRLPVRTASEASILINKIVNYVPGQSAQGALLVADHASGNDFEGASSTLGQQLPAGMPVQIVNRGTQDASTVRNQIISNLNQGPQVVNYFGHGSVGLWTGAGLLTTGDAAGLSNGNRLPLFTMMTCLNGYFHDVSGDSLAEALLKSQNGGAVAVWASSGQTNMEGQLQVAQPLYQLLFGGQPMTLGDAVRGAKSATGDQGVRRSWIFFGDPTQRIR